MGMHENKLKWCINKAKKEIEEGTKHRGILVVEPNKAKAKKHIEKALTNIDVAELMLKNNHLDWSVVAIFYAMYHSLLAALVNFGYESRNQDCTFAAILSLINEGKIKIDADKIEKIKQENSIESIGEEPKDVISLREYSQYEVDTEYIQRKKIEEMKKEAITLIREIREELGI